jgi:hypothetical protein
MQRHRLALVLVAAVLPLAATPVPAGAKGVAKVKVCGAGGCQSADNGQEIAGAVFGGGTSGRPPSSGQPFYRFKVYMQEPGSRRSELASTFLYLPRQHLVARPGRYGSREWVRLDPSEETYLHIAISGRPPYPAAQLPLHRVPSAAPVAALPERGPAASTDAGGGGLSPWWIALIATAVPAAAAAVVLRRRRGPAH